MRCGRGRHGQRYVRKMDALGRIVIPSETRRLFNMREGDELTISVEGQSVKVEKLDATCTFCGSTERVRSFHGKGICASCTAELSYRN